MKTTELSNSFHNSSVRVDARWAEKAQGVDTSVLDYLYYEGVVCGDPAARRAYNRVSRTLCGIKECKCGIVR